MLRILAFVCYSFILTESTPTPTKKAFIIVDVQNCFVPGGTLAVNKGNGVVGPINKILKGVKFDLVVRTQDWHCKNHVSFASQHKNVSAFGVLTLNYTTTGKLCGDYPYNKTKKTCNKDDVKYSLQQTMWPDHCIIGTDDAKFVSSVKFPSNGVTVQKGYHCEVDSYSAFFDNGGFTATELNQVLKNKQITQVYVAGLATDYCVSYTAKDAKKLGYKSTVVMDASAAIATSSLEKEKVEWGKLGVNTINTDVLIDSFKSSGNRNIHIFDTKLLAFLLFLILKIINI